MKKKPIAEPLIVTMSLDEYRVLSHKAAKCDRFVAAFEAEGKTA